MFRKIFCMLLIMVLLAGCTSTVVEEPELLPKPVIDNSKLFKGTSFENLDIPKDYNIKQFEGMTLNFIVENNLYANILSHENEEFSEITGINIKIRPVDFDTLVQKINLDFIGQSGNYQIVYVDPYQTLNRFYDYLEVLNPYNENPAMPHVEGFMSDFFTNQVEACSYFENNENVYTIPFDSTTMILYYRKDIFDKYKDKFMQDKGYDWTPGRGSFTWERYYEAAQWINENVPDSEVKYGCGLMAQKHNSIFCEFSNIMAAYGGDYFSDPKINTLGLRTFENITVQKDDFIKALDMYKKIASVAAPQSVNWNWTDLARAFRNGEVALMANWDENYTYVEDAKNSKVAGKVGYSILPYGIVRSANIYGGSGIGINKYATEAEKQAAWLYIAWATSKDMQLKVLNHPEGGSLPTRTSAYFEPIYSSEGIPNSSVQLKHKEAVLNAWKPQHIYMRPKLSNFFDVEKVLITELHAMIEKNIDSKETSNRIFEKLEQIRIEHK